MDRMNTLLWVVLFLHVVSHAYGRTDYTLDDPKTRFSRSTQDKYSLNLLHIDDGTIIFPREENHSNDHHHHHLYKKPKINPNICENDICENVDDYPTEFVNTVLSKSKEFQEYFALKIPAGTSEFITPMNVVPLKVAYGAAPPAQHKVSSTQDVTFSVSDRVGGVGEFEEQTLCSASVRTQKPQSGKNLNGISIDLVNTDLFEQLIVTEICEANKQKCKFSSAFPNNYESGCKQKYTNHRLMSFNSSGHFVDTFPIPTCCVCYIKKIGL